MKNLLSSKLGHPISRYKVPCADGALATFIMGTGVICSELPFHDKAEKLLLILSLVVLYIVIASRVNKAQG